MLFACFLYESKQTDQHYTRMQTDNQINGFIKASLSLSQALSKVLLYIPANVNLHFKIIFPSNN
jgi:hypothetical protein